MKKFLSIIFCLSILFTLNSNGAEAKKLDEVNKWYPIGISEKPHKVEYKEGEKVDLSGLKIRFVRYVKNQIGTYEVEYKDEAMNDYTIKYGWELMLPAKNVYNPLVDIKLRLIKPLEAKSVMDEITNPLNS